MQNLLAVTLEMLLGKALSVQYYRAKYIEQRELECQIQHLHEGNIYIYTHTIYVLMSTVTANLHE